MIRLVQSRLYLRVKPTDQPIVPWLIHPLTEPCTGQVLARAESSLAGHADGVLLVVSARKKHVTHINLNAKEPVKHRLSSQIRCKQNPDDSD